MKTLIKQFILAATLAFSLMAHAQLIGSWQGSGSALTRAGDEGWIDWGNGLSITNPANTNKYQFVTGAVAGYNQSLQISNAGYNQNLAIKLENLSGGKAAFLNNYLLAFTFSVPSSAASGSTAGYSQMYQLVVNASGLGFAGQAFSTNTWSETGSTNNDSASGQPNYYFYGGAPARSQTLVFNYSNILSQITATTNSGYIELIFTFNNGGGAATNYFMNNVELLGSAAQAPPGAIIVDDFVPAGVSSTNPTNYDRYSSAEVYSSGQITNVYGNWFGGAFSSLEWDPSTDAGNNPTSGSLEINLNWSGGSQFVVWDQGSANNYFALSTLGINGTQYTNFQCDVKFAPGSVSAQGSASQPIFGHLRFGHRTSSYGQDWFGAVDVAATNTNWVHVSVSLNAVTDTSLTNMGGLIIGIDSGFYGLNFTSGDTTLWVDNLEFTGPTTAVKVAPPTLAMQKATPGLRIFAGSTANVYDREELATTDNNQSWVGGSYPVSYSFSLSDYPANINQTHIFIVPQNTAGGAMGNDGTLNEYIEYQATNMLWMVINPGAGGQVVASVQWKTNLPNANPNQTALTITNSKAVGTWTLTFTSPSTGTLTAPGASPAAFIINDANVTTDFANPAVAYFGLQPNSTAGEGEFEDWGSISVTGVSGAQESEQFNNESSFNQNGYWAINGANTTGVQFVPSSTAYWINWTLPANGFGLGTATSLTGNTNTSGYPWVLPEYYNNYGDGLNLPGGATQGTNFWVQIPTYCLPTSDGTVGGPISSNAFFKLFNPPLSN